MVTLRSLAPHRFVSLTTFRTNGEPVSTPVWVIGDGNDLLVLTPAGTGKVRRVLRDPRVEVRPCSRRGVVHDHAPTATGWATIEATPVAVEAMSNLLAAKYGAEYRAFMAVERLARHGNPPRVVLRVSPA